MTSEAAREAESKSQTSGGLSREEIARQLHRAGVIANRAAQDGRLGRLDSGQHIAPARRCGHGRRRAAKAANVDAGHVVSSLRPFPLDVALRAVAVAVHDERARRAIQPAEAVAADFDPA